MSILRIREASLEDMLDARDKRQARRERLMNGHGITLVCLTMNIAGPIKRTPLVELLFREGVERISRTFNAGCVELVEEHTGLEACFCIDAPAVTVKESAVSIEDAFPAARLFDIDVFGSDGEKLERANRRSCIVCGAPAAVCARSRAHGLEAVTAAANALMCEFAAGKLALMAREALVAEVCVTPKPGLVDEANNGAHDDMDMGSFIKSAFALTPFFSEMVSLGLSGLYTGECEPVMARLKRSGQKAERDMLGATYGVNTHKGMIYSLGLILFALGDALRASDAGEVFDADEVFALASRLAGFDMEAAQARAALSRQCATHGESVYRKFSAPGIRGEAALGFPNARMAANALYDYRKRHGDNDAAVLTLLDIMCVLEDTNVLYRGGRDGLELMREKARAASALPENGRVAAAAELDAQFIELGLSPGGCADTLALALFIAEAGL